MAASVLANRARMTTNTTGVVPFVLDGAAARSQTFAQAGITNGQTVRYAAESSDGTQWEVGQGVYTSATKTLTRVTIYDSSSGGAVVNFATEPEVWVDASKETFWQLGHDLDLNGQFLVDNVAGNSSTLNISAILIHKQAFLADPTIMLSGAIEFCPYWYELWNANSGGDLGSKYIYLTSYRTGAGLEFNQDFYNNDTFRVAADALYSTSVTPGSEGGEWVKYLQVAGVDTTVFTLGATDVFGGLAHVFDWGAYDGPELLLQSSNPGQFGATIRFYQGSATPAVNDIVGQLSFDGKDSGGNLQNYGGMWVDIADPTNTSEDGRVNFKIRQAGQFLEVLGLGVTGFDGSFGATFDFGTAEYPNLVVQNSPAADGGGEIAGFANSPSPAGSDNLIWLTASGRDSAANIQYYGGLGFTINDPTSTSEDTKARIQIASGGATINAFTVEPGNFAFLDNTAQASLSLTQTDNGAAYPIIWTYANSASPAIGDGIMQIAGYGKNSAHADVNPYGEILLTIDDPTAGSEDTDWAFYVRSAGSSVAALTLGVTDFAGAPFSHIFDFGSNDGPNFDLQNSSAGNGGVFLNFYMNSASPALNDLIGTVTFNGRDSTGTLIDNPAYGSFTCYIKDATHGSLDSDLEFNVLAANSNLVALVLGSVTNEGNFGHVFDIGTTNYGGVQITGSSPADGGPGLVFFHNSPSPAINDDLGYIEWRGKDSVLGSQQYAEIDLYIVDPTNGNESTQLQFTPYAGGLGLHALTLNGYNFDWGVPTVEFAVSDVPTAGYGVILNKWNPAVASATGFSHQSTGNVASGGYLGWFSWEFFINGGFANSSAIESVLPDATLNHHYVTMAFRHISDSNYVYSYLADGAYWFPKTTHTPDENKIGKTLMAGGTGATDNVGIFFRETGGQQQLCGRFRNGNVVVFATEGDDMKLLLDELKQQKAELQVISTLLTEQINQLMKLNNPVQIQAVDDDQLDNLRSDLLNKGR